MLLSLDENQIDIWQTSVSLFQENHAIGELEAMLTESGLEAIALIRRPSEKLVKVVSRAFLRSVLAKYTGLAPQAIQFERGLHGKPQLVNQGLSLEFNLSHSDNVLACALSKKNPIGLDVERIRFKRNLIRLGHPVFSEDEKREFESLPEAAKEAYFFDRWILKESLIKVTGQGLTTKLNNVSFGQSNASASFSAAGVQSMVVESEYASWL
ncbi:4'-phosphopantetheinyl transferase superfamily protein [Pseudoalteromonas sp. MMG005]|uniref:4'-phosphopantetheinyl transferase family protein n=1 Tax=Pseudoalteromonas sp. MMG005 TaxID=2822682 RepID=UPI001B3A7127|nr:4'-phosphopantetheinyl transferase superfamily protein [Pseudoalteromonas sp. MMG005]MBQ4847829.1 4'-phosphopantetheinyl transferase superfamily protein [Pseudoalteromonas sp. MMG005]